MNHQIGSGHVIANLKGHAVPARVLCWPAVGGGGGGGGEDVGGVAGRRRQAAPAPPPRRPWVPPTAVGAALVEVVLAEAVTLLVSTAF